MAGAGNTYKLKVAYTNNDDHFTFTLPVAYDVIQVQLHLTGTPAAGDQAVIEGKDEDGDLVLLPGGTGTAGAFLLSSHKVLQFAWKGPQVKITYKEADCTALTVKVKTFMENVGDADRGTEYLIGTIAMATRALRGD
jgi:hypothetical protein